MSAISSLRPHLDAGTPDLGSRRLLGPDGREMPPSFALPHERTFTAVYNSISQTYRYSFDEALRDNPQAALEMRHDTFIQALLQERYLSVVHLKRSVVADDPKDPRMKAGADRMNRIIRGGYKFQKQIMELMEHVWYGRYGSQVVIGEKNIDGQRCRCIVRHRPVNGDKIHWDYQDNPLIRVNPQWATEYRASLPKGEADRRLVSDTKGTPWKGSGSDWAVPTGDRGPMLRLEGREWRERFVIAQAWREDSDYFEGELAGGIAGVGLRHKIYWNWFLRRQVIEWIMSAAQRAGAGGIWLFYYQDGNKASKAKAEYASKNLDEQSAFTIPVGPGSTREQSGAEVVPVTTEGLKFLSDLVSTYFERHIERLFVGQSMSGGSGPGEGMGSSKWSDFAENTKWHITKYDAGNIDEYSTDDLLKPLVRLNEPELVDCLRLESAVPDPDAEKKLESAKAIFDMGIPVKSDEIRDAAGLTAPDDDDEVVQQAGEEVSGEDAAGPAPHEQDGQKNGRPDNPLVKPQFRNPLMRPELRNQENGAQYQFDADEFLGRLRTAAADVHPTPTEAQKESGNYAKGHLTWKGLPLTIETARGQERSGKSKDGKPWSVTMRDHYGYIKRTESEADGDHIDVFLSEDYPESDVVFVVNQQKPDGSFDEHKCVLGQISEDGAKAAYLRNYSPGWTGFHSMKAMSLREFKRWVERGWTGDPVQYATSAGHWVTIGAKDGHGGTRVFITGDGKIARGPAKLAGRALSSLKAHQERREDEAREHEYRMAQAHAAMMANQPQGDTRDPTLMEMATGIGREPGVGKPSIAEKMGEAHAPTTAEPNRTPAGSVPPIAPALPPGIADFLKKNNLTVMSPDQAPKVPANVGERAASLVGRAEAKVPEPERIGGGKIRGETPAADEKAQSWLEQAKALPAAVVEKAKGRVQGIYSKLERRYGPGYAKAIVASGLAGVPLPVPGSSVLTAAPMIAVAELHRLLAGKGETWNPESQSQPPTTPPTSAPTTSNDSGASSSPSAAPTPTPETPTTPAAEPTPPPSERPPSPHAAKVEKQKAERAGRADAKVAKLNAMKKLAEESGENHPAVARDLAGIIATMDKSEAISVARLLGVVRKVTTKQDAADAIRRKVFEKKLAQDAIKYAADEDAREEIELSGRRWAKMVADQMPDDPDAPPRKATRKTIKRDALGLPEEIIIEELDLPGDEP